MTGHLSTLGNLVLPLVLVTSVVACAPSGPIDQEGAPPEQDSGRTKVVVFGVRGTAQAMGVMGSPTTSGGWHSATDIHSHGLITTEAASRTPIGRLAERVPTLDDGSIELLPDGRMRVEYTLRKGITWQDGAPFTAQDLVFSYQFNRDKGLPTNQRPVIDLMTSAEAPDDDTFVITYSSGYYLGGLLGTREFWPQPQHILGSAYDRYLAIGDPDEVANLPYWTSEYIHLGPFRLTTFDPIQGAQFEAYEGYFLGRPKVDRVEVRTFSDENALFASLLAGAVDIFADTALSTELGFQLKDRWDSTGEGSVYARPGSTRFLASQWRPSVQTEPANLDPRVRAALYQAIDRDGLSEREQAAWSILPPGDRLYDATKDGLRRYPYDPERARAALRDLGWTSGQGGVLQHTSDGRRFRTVISTTAGGRDWEVPVYADYWRRIGLEVEEHIIPGAQTRDLELRAQYPGWEASSSGPGDSILGRLEGPAATAENRWTGNRGGYEDPQAQTLLNRYYTAISQRDQFDAMRALSDFIIAELPILPAYYLVDLIGVRNGVRALDDVEGGAIITSPPFGSYSRNAYLWDVE
ncbi:MAG: hypothetical protein GEU73_00120 [Chloroflexi bacterium]|nr:hypothetical protein [Chloroflexota bacterium]